MQTPKQVISEIKLRIRGVDKQIADLEQQIIGLKRERYFFEQIILRDELIQATRKSNLIQKWAKKLSDGQKRPRRNMVKSIMEVQ